jgi:hypothetical protein
MKRILIISVIVGLFFFSCKKDGRHIDPAASGESAEGAFFISEQDAGFNGANYGYVLRVNASFYTLETDTGEESDKTKWAASMALGDEVTVGKIRKLTFGGDGKIYDFAEVRRDDGKDGFAWAAHIGAGGNLAVVIDEKANLYSSPKAVDVTGTILPRKTVVVFYPDTERDGMVEMRAYDSAAQRNRNNFIRLTSISEKTSDIQSSILLQTAEPLKNEGNDKIRRDALLGSAMTDYPDSVFRSDIMALAVPNTVAQIQTEVVNRSFIMVNDNDVNILDIPDPVAGRIIGQLSGGDGVTVNLQTVNTSTIDGQSARWYRLTEPAEGWVFGAYLE